MGQYQYDSQVSRNAIERSGTQIGVYLNAGNAEFSSAVNSEIYVDKTEMLEYLNSILGTEQRYVCVSRPRRFGKSIAARMVAAYYNKGCDSRDLFSGHAIATANSFETHLNKYNVIQLDIAYLRTYPLNNFKEHTMTSPKRLAKYVGFTEEEVKALCGQYRMDFQETQRWYDG